MAARAERLPECHATVLLRRDRFRVIRSSLAFEPQVLLFSRKSARHYWTRTKEFAIPGFERHAVCGGFPWGSLEPLLINVAHARLTAPIGVVMLATGSEENAIDLAYLGVVLRAVGVSARAGGIRDGGRFHRGGASIAVAVDFLRNEPRSLYAHTGSRKSIARGVVGTPYRIGKTTALFHERCASIWFDTLCP